MITPVPHNLGFWPSLSDFFEPADSSGTSFLPQDSSWEKYATPALQAARFFSPGLDVALAAGEVLGTAYSGVSSGSDQAESHWGRNLLIFGSLCVLGYLMVRPLPGRLRKYELLARDAKPSFESDEIFPATIEYLQAMVAGGSPLRDAARVCLEGIGNGGLTKFSQVNAILESAKNI